MLERWTDRLKKALHILRFGYAPSMGEAQLSRLEPEDLQDVKSFFKMPKFFIFGHARSGTTLLARLIRVHPEVHCNWQSHFFTREPTLFALVDREDVRKWLHHSSFRWNHGEELAPKVIRVVADFIMEREARQQGKSIVGDKSPNNYMPGKSVRMLHEVYPDGKLIFIIRDGRDTVLSHRFQNFIDFPEYLSGEDLQIRDDFSEDPAPFYNGERSIFTEKWLQNDIQSWVQNVQETTDVGRQLFGDQFKTIKYEELLVEPTKQMNALWAFLGADLDRQDHSEAISREIDRNPDADWQKSQNAQMLENLEKGKSGSWQALFTRRDRQIVKDAAGETLIRWGYEDGLAW